MDDTLTHASAAGSRAELLIELGAVTKDDLIAADGFVGGDVLGLLRRAGCEIRAAQEEIERLKAILTLKDDIGLVTTQEFGTPIAIVRRDIWDKYEQDLHRMRAVVDEQANYHGLWFVPQTITEDILQRALRRLHVAVEGKGEIECAIDVLRVLDATVGKQTNVQP